MRLLVDLTNEDDVVALFVPAEGGRYLVASSSGRGFIVAAADLLAEKRTGKQVLNLRPGEEAALCVPAEGDHVAVIGTSRKLLIFPLDQVPEMARGAGVILQRYRDGGLADTKVFRLADGLSWKLGDRVRTEIEPARLARRARSGRPHATFRLPSLWSFRVIPDRERLCAVCVSAVDLVEERFNAETQRTQRQARHPLVA